MHPLIRFLFPQLFLLAIPVWFAYRRWGRAPGIAGGLRCALLAVLLLALTGPQINRGGQGLDLVVVADRSRSLPPQSEDRIRELIQNLERQRGRGDRIAVVAFGGVAASEVLLSGEEVLKNFSKDVSPDGSDLNEALHTALDLLQDNARPARILVLSDGEANGPSPRAAGSRARERGVPIDFREFPRERAGDVAVESLSLPDTVAPREPFQYSVWVYAERETAGRVTVLRDGQVIMQDQADRQFTVGRNRLLFRDLLDGGGLFQYEVRVATPNDPLPENNRGAGVVRVDAGPRLLVLNADGQADNFTRALQAGNLPVDIAPAKTQSLAAAELDRYRAVVLENVPAADLGRLKMDRLAQFVEDLGGGLMLTGGERSFGTGGYFKSPLDEVLPVSMELRNEHRKTQLAMAIALDRSGSMAVPVKGGKVKMDLANLGTAECVRLLSPGDSVAIIAVDSSPHVIQPLTPVEDAEAIARKVLKVESMGGGIFVYEALVAAGEQLLKADQNTRHIILFSDANDSEEPGDYKSLLAKFEAAGITVSVIGLGTKTDVDAHLLEDIAKLGKGNILFTDDPEELPRLFTQDTMSVARNTFIKKDPTTQPDGIGGQITPAAQLMGELTPGRFPPVDGYNLSYLKPDATLGVVSQDEYAAPFSAVWYRGLGRVAAVTLEVDGRYSGGFGVWDEYADFNITHARWLLGGAAPDDAFLTMTRDGQDAVVQLELDPDRPQKLQVDAPSLSVIAPGNERVAAAEIPFQWNGPNSLEARFRLTQTGAYRTLARLGGRSIVRGPAITLPYSPEFMPRIGVPTGSEVLHSLAELTGGKPRIDVLEVLADPPRSARTTSLLPWLFMLAISILIVEIGGRRLGLWSKLARGVAAEPAEATAPSHMSPSVKPAKRRLPWAKSPPTASPASSPRSVAAAVAPPAKAPAASDVFEQAKQRAKRRNQ